MPNRILPQAVCTIAAALLTLVVADARAAALRADETRIDGGARRVVAVGDIHGADDGARAILREAGLIDAGDRWIGGDAILVQTGDFLDRGAGATRVAELLMRLQAEAPRDGGEVIVLLGNHEALNLLVDLRDVTGDILAGLVDGESEARVAASCDGFASFHRKLAEKRRQKVPKRRALYDHCVEQHPRGLVEYLDEIGPEGRLGRWLRTLPVAVQIDGVVFLHGGISPALAGRSLERINREARREIERFDRARRRLIDRGLILPTSGLVEIVSVARKLAAGDAGSGFPPSPDLKKVASIDRWLILREDGPLWFRGYASWPEAEGRSRLDAILEPLGAEHIVVAHTPQQATIGQRFDSRVFLIDTGMLERVYRGRPSALELVDGRFSAIYATQRAVLFEPGVLARAH